MHVSSRDTVRDTVRDVVRDVVRNVVRDTVRDVVRDTVRDTVWDAMRDTVRDPRYGIQCGSGLGAGALRSMVSDCIWGDGLTRDVRQGCESDLGHGIWDLLGSAEENLGLEMEGSVRSALWDLRPRLGSEGLDWDLRPGSLGLVDGIVANAPLWKYSTPSRLTIGIWPYFGLRSSRVFGQSAPDGEVEAGWCGVASVMRWGGGCRTGWEWCGSIRVGGGAIVGVRHNGVSPPLIRLSMNPALPTVRQSANRSLSPGIAAARGVQE